MPQLLLIQLILSFVFKLNLSNLNLVWTVLTKEAKALGRNLEKTTLKRSRQLLGFGNEHSIA